MASATIPAYAKETKGKYAWAVVHIAGRKYRLGTYDSPQSLERYHRLVAEWLASGCAKSFGRSTPQLTIGNLVDDYVSHCEEYFGTGPNSEVYRCNYDTRLIQTLVKLYGSLPAAEFTGRQFKAVRHQLVLAGLVRSNINASMRRITRMFKWAAGEGMVPPTVPQVLMLIPGLRYGQAAESDPVKPVDDEIVDATLPHLPPIVADMVRVQRLTAMRPAEVCMMRPCDIDRTGPVWEYRPQRHKTLYRGKDRVVAIGPQAQAVLRRYLLRDAKAYCFSPKETDRLRIERVRSERPTRTTTQYPCEVRRLKRKRKRHPKKKPGECYTPRSYCQAIHVACRKAFTLPDDIAGDRELVAEWRHKHSWSPNRLRHSAATEIRRKFGLEAAQVTLGHSRANVTEVYAERNFELAARVAAAVG